MNTDTIPAPSVSSALTVQGRVIYALVLREVHTLYGNTRLGYLWAIIQTAFNIAVFWLFREFLGAHSRHGMGIGVFLLCGFIAWHMVSDTLSRCMSAVRANQALLTFPGDGTRSNDRAGCCCLGNTEHLRSRYLNCGRFDRTGRRTAQSWHTCSDTIICSSAGHRHGVSFRVLSSPLAHTGKTRSYRDAFFVLCVRRLFSGF